MVKKRSAAAQQNADVRISDRGGYAYGELGTSDRTVGIIPFGDTTSRDKLTRQVPAGTFFFNTDTNSLEISDPDNTLTPTVSGWIGVSTSGALVSSGSDIPLGLPSDGDFGDGALPLNPSGSIADAVDELNEYLLSLSTVLSGNLHETLRWDGADYSPSDALINDDTDVYVQNRLTISGSVVIPSGTAPGSSGDSGDEGELRYDKNFIYLYSSGAWTRSPRAMF